MRILVVGKGSRVFGRDDIAAAMLPHGHELVDPSEARDQLRGDALLLLGFENWYLDAPLELLDRAAAAGIPRILWQFEPLLPPGLPALTHGFVSRSTGPSARPPVARTGIIDQLSYGYRIPKLVVAARRQSWGSTIFSPHVFKYPIQQSRNVASFWDGGLFDHIFVSLRPRAAFLGELGIPCSFVPTGYSPTFGRSAEHGDRDIDVLFFGQVTSRRRALLNSIDAALRHAGYALKLIDGDFYADERTAILNRSKIVLNLHKFPWEFAGQRLLMAMSCRALVVSEWAPDTTPYKHGEHMFTARVEQLPEILVTLLNDQSRRQAVAEAGYQFVTTDLRLERILPAALEAIVSKAIP
jgi:hypothetical protein